ncbi:MAG TPA: hypothetical protein VFS29_11715 [Motilibacteraceae bacterium]|nr:hypothetical protein [Motilibacteraceae bacterium]
MDESREGGMQSGWPGEWPRPEQHVPSAPPQAAGQEPAGSSWETTGWPGRSGEPDEPGAQAPADRPHRTSRGALSAVGLVLAGALAGGIGIAAVQHGSTTTASTAAQGLAGAPGPAGGQGQLGQGQLGQGQLGQGFPGGAGRDDDEQRLVGTVTTVSGSSVTVQTQSGTTTYQVNADTQVIKDGQVATLSDLASGDQVLVHVIPGDSTPTVERIIAGRLPQQLGGPGVGRGPGGPGDGGPGDGQQGGAAGGTTGLRT